MKHNKEITTPNFGDAINIDRVSTFSLLQLKALDNLLNGKATVKDYDALKGAI